MSCSAPPHKKCKMCETKLLLSFRTRLSVISCYCLSTVINNLCFSKLRPFKQIFYLKLDPFCSRDSTEDRPSDKDAVWGFLLEAYPARGRHWGDPDISGELSVNYNLCIPLSSSKIACRICYLYVQTSKKKLMLAGFSHGQTDDLSNDRWMYIIHGWIDGWVSWSTNHLSLDSTYLKLIMS